MSQQAVGWSLVRRKERGRDKYPRWMRVTILLGGIALSWALVIKIIDSVW